MTHEDLQPGSVTTVPMSRRMIALLLDWGIGMAIAAGFFDYHPMAILAIFVAQRTLVGGLLGYSIGQRVAGLHIVRLVDGTKAALWQVLVRTLMICLILPPLYGTMAGVPLHDYVAGTRLIVRR